MHTITPENISGSLTLNFIIAGAVVAAILVIVAKFSATETDEKTGALIQNPVLQFIMTLAGWGMIAGVILMLYAYWFHRPNHIIFAIGAFLAVAGAPYHMYISKKQAEQEAERDNN